MNEPTPQPEPLPALELLRVAAMSAGALLIAVAIFEALRRMRGN